MKIKQLYEYQVIDTGFGTIIENPNKNIIMNKLETWPGMRGIMAFDMFWIANAYDMVHNDVLKFIGLDPSMPHNTFIIQSRDNDVEIGLDSDLSYNELPRSIQSSIEELRNQGNRIEVLEGDSESYFLEPLSETASAGATAAGAVATVNQPMGGVIRRNADSYVNQTIVGPDGKPIKQLGNKKDRKKRKKKNLNEGKLYKVQDIPVIKRPTDAQLENLANKSKWEAVRITLDKQKNMWAWPADTLTHNDVDYYLSDEGLRSQKIYNFTLMKGEDGVVWKAFADNNIADSASFDRMMNISSVQRAIGQADFDPQASNEFWGPV